MLRRTNIYRLLGALLVATSLAIFSASVKAQLDNRVSGLGERRAALVIGNSDYPFSPLKNPVNDARDMARALRTLGFDVDHRENVGLRPMIEAIRHFVLRADAYDVRLLYYAGHGVQMNGKNYLIPTDADIHVEEDIPSNSADVSEMLERLGQVRTGLNLVILDACRNNPFADGAILLADGRRLRFRGLKPSGLAAIDAPTGTLVAFSTAPGSVAIDSPDADNSLYTKHLLANLGIPGLPIEQLFKRVRIEVTDATKRRQVPWESSSLMGDFCFKPTNAGICRYEGSRQVRF